LRNDIKLPCLKVTGEFGSPFWAGGCQPQCRNAKKVFILLQRAPTQGFSFFPPLLSLVSVANSDARIFGLFNSKKKSARRTGEKLSFSEKASALDSLGSVII